MEAPIKPDPKKVLDDLNRVRPETNTPREESHVVPPIKPSPMKENSVVVPPRDK